jgi:nucleoside-diphosphate-sugar epimerase
MDVRIVRIFNTYGPRMDINDGRVIPNFVKEALAGEKLSIYGDGSQTRSYCFVDDLIKGIMLLAGNEGLKGTTLNLGNPGEFTILETAKMIWKEVHGDSEIQLVFSDLPIDDPMRRRPDITKAQEVLNWSPTVPFTEGLQKTVKYFQK